MISQDSLKSSIYKAISSSFLLYDGNELQNNSKFLYYIEDIYLRDLSIYLSIYLIYIYVLIWIICVVQIGLLGSTRVCHGLTGSNRICDEGENRHPQTTHHLGEGQTEIIKTKYEARSS
jgi:hypothetical protein